MERQERPVLPRLTLQAAQHDLSQPLRLPVGEATAVDLKQLTAVRVHYLAHRQ